MTIKQLIGGKVALLTANGETYTFLHSGAEYQNLFSDEAVLPCAYLYMPMKYKPVITTSGMYQVNYICEMVILFKSEIDDNDAQQEEIFRKSEIAVRQFLLLLDSDSDNVRDLVIGEVMQVQYNQDACLSGAYFNFSLRIINYDGVC